MLPLALLAPPLLDMAGKIFDKIIPDKNAAEKAKQELATLMQNQEFQTQLKQIEVNLEEAKSPSIFVAGWRPFCGWICGFALGYNYILLPIGQFFIYAFADKEMVETFKQLPAIDFSVMLPVLLGMLGLAGARMREKEKGVAREKWSVNQPKPVDSPFPDQN